MMVQVVHCGRKHLGDCYLFGIYIRLPLFGIVFTFCNCWGSSPETLCICTETLYICTHRSNYLIDRISVRSDSWLGHQGAKTEIIKTHIRTSCELNLHTQFWPARTSSEYM
jgi:hypothetical protein